jgi:hypothetical protein
MPRLSAALDSSARWTVEAEHIQPAWFECAAPHWGTPDPIVLRHRSRNAVPSALQSLLSADLTLLVVDDRTLRKVTAQAK